MTNDEFFDIGRVAYITGNVQEALAAKQTLEKVVESANSLQQLKAEICKLYIEYRSKLLSVSIDELPSCMDDLLSELDKLSAV